MIRRTGELLRLNSKSLILLLELSYNKHVSLLINTKGQQYLNAYVKEVKNKL